MRYRKIKALYHLSEFLNSFNELSEIDRYEVLKEETFKDALTTFRNNLVHESPIHNIMKSKSVEDYDFEVMMNDIKNMLKNRRLSQSDKVISIEWLLKLLLKEPSLFTNVSELDTFLANVSGLKHETKSTGRDRIVDWYFKKIDQEYSENERNKILFQIVKYIFATYSSNYREWSNLLSKIKG
jgi:hypothetical protein